MRSTVLRLWLHYLVLIRSALYLASTAKNNTVVRLYLKTYAEKTHGRMGLYH